MNVKSKLKQLEKINLGSKTEICRLSGCDGNYPEQEQDVNESRKVLQVSVEGVSCEELRQWAK